MNEHSLLIQTSHGKYAVTPVNQTGVELCQESIRTSWQKIETTEEADLAFDVLRDGQIKGDLEIKLIPDPITPENFKQLFRSEISRINRYEDTLTAIGSATKAILVDPVSHLPMAAHLISEGYSVASEKQRQRVNEALADLARTIMAYLEVDITEPTKS